MTWEGLKRKSAFFMKRVPKHRKYESKSKLLVKRAPQDNPITIIFVLAVWPGEAYEMVFCKTSSKRDVLNMGCWGRNGSPSLRFQF